MTIILTDFARPRLFPREPRRNTIQDITPEHFERHLNDVRPLQRPACSAPYSKLHRQRNRTTTRSPPVPLTAASRHLLHSDYDARTKDELPVLVRWSENIDPPEAEYLIVILYSREQLAK